MANPPINLPASNLTQSLAAGEAVLEPLTSDGMVVPDALILLNLSIPCTLPADGAGTVFIEYEHVFYRSDQRLELVDNALDHPALTSDATSADFCPAAAHSFLNAGGGCARAYICDAGVQACGSPGEVANDPTKGHKYHLYTAGGEQNSGKANRLRQIRTTAQKHVVWTNAVLKAPDQLRQRMAWALSQIYVVSITGFDQVMATEAWQVWNDIFVRNAFGNLRDLLKEVSHSPAMGSMLTFRGSQAIQVSGNYPDENYAREFVQLFTVGFHQLANDGTQLRDAAGETITTYDTADVVSFARAWTGFDEAPTRGNQENKYNGGNALDPMRINPESRDPYPKMDLHDGWIGDRHPLCADLPPRAFLRKGATWVFRGPAPASMLQGGPLLLADASQLGQQLCSPHQEGGLCSFPADVTLAANLPCHGTECGVDRAPMVRIINGNTTAFYEHLESACVHQAFYHGRMVKGFGWHHHVQCAAESTPAAGAACCSSPDSMSETANADFCDYAAERLTWRTAVQRCENATARGHGSPMYLCRRNARAVASGDCTDEYGYTWLSQRCSTIVQVRADRSVSVVHRIDEGETFDDESLAGGSATVVWNENYAVDSQNVFTVSWQGRHGVHVSPLAAANCSDLTACAVHGDTCLCAVELQSGAVFFDSSTVPTRRAVLERLHVGAPDPESFDAGTYELLSSSAGGRADVEVFRLAQEAAGEPYSQRTIFKVELDGRPVFLMNTRLDVAIPGNHGIATGFAFRQPVHFRSDMKSSASIHYLNNLGDYERREAEAETDAVIEHALTHPSTAPFIAKKLIQRFTSSNPSPRFVDAVATAFRLGQHAGQVYSGAYGCLAATTAAILLDREARDSVLDMDPTAGKLREPLLKVLHFVRALEFSARDGEMATALSKSVFRCASTVLTACFLYVFFVR